MGSLTVLVPNCTNVNIKESQPFGATRRWAANVGGGAQRFNQRASQSPSSVACGAASESARQWSSAGPADVYFRRSIGRDLDSSCTGLRETDPNTVQFSS